ncbi:hypothetical protein J3D54_005418 [Pseudomonas sp. GGS8]|uniref:hypothetical protein n=1 Tax=Pseudomonas sp. GGS8 TaxID=2817892 RepID=UPI00209FD45C|nr:hypothetical protein [Pseudomonas sp. GGS8]MCP1446286.1 hypothetical protein [Pseudomonas sp. GGS8]
MYEPLKIKQSVGEDIKLEDIPLEGGTALIPEYEDYNERDTLDVYIENEKVVTRHNLRNPIDGYFAVLIPKDAFLRNLGAERKFKYVIFLRGINPVTSETALFNLHL